MKQAISPPGPTVINEGYSPNHVDFSEVLEYNKEDILEAVANIMRKARWFAAKSTAQASPTWRPRQLTEPGSQVLSTADDVRLSPVSEDEARIKAQGEELKIGKEKSRELTDVQSGGRQIEKQKKSSDEKSTRNEQVSRKGFVNTQPSPESGVVKFKRIPDSIVTVGPVSESGQLTDPLELAKQFHEGMDLNRAAVLYEKMPQRYKRSASPEHPTLIIPQMARSVLIRLQEGFLTKPEQLDEAARSLKVLLQISRENGDPDSVKALQTTRYCALYDYLLGDYAAAELKLRDIRTKLESKCEPFEELHATLRDLRERGAEPSNRPEEFELLSTSSVLALILAKQGKYKDAEKLADETAKSQSIWPGPDHRTTLRTKLILATILKLQGVYGESFLRTREVLLSSETKLGSHHKITLDLRSVFAQLLLIRGESRRAEEECQLALILMRKQLGREHLLTLSTLAVLVSIYKSQARWTRAIDIAKYIIGCYTRILGDRNPETLAVKNDLALLYVLSGELQAAKDQQDETVDAFAKALGSDHPVTLASKADLASIYFNLGYYRKARQLATETLSKQLKILGKESKQNDIETSGVPAHREPMQSPDLGKSGDRIHTGLSPSRGVPVDVEGGKAHLSAEVKWNFYSTHPAILSTKHTIGILEREEGDLEASRSMLKEVLEERHKVLDVDHPDSLSAQFDLSITCRLYGGLQEAETELNDVLVRRKKTLGPRHPDTLSAIHEWAVTRAQLGDLIVAERVQLEVLEIRLDLRESIIRISLALI